jgi:hypothetical protein
MRVNRQDGGLFLNVRCLPLSSHRLPRVASNEQSLLMIHSNHDNIVNTIKKMHFQVMAAYRLTAEALLSRFTLKPVSISIPLYCALSAAVKRE